ncbi:PHP domain-containing protein [Balneolaceae bacterium YR4-1]|uniref:PHP domain-containing protein n=1 Tax=Halalkalibaculum roseum TaxID=2709311 RepID=A0A6M1TAN4_9BACT|nr:PHP domain-containing protein [Halalkalibaculum roseum]NGP77223.1 PHP domain-containing protein [Halalkalibaculum roseum]
MGKADLHIHTTASDGNSTPAEIVKLAAEQNLEVISITDHDSIAGLEEALEAAREFGIEVIPGSEITATYEEREAHLLAYGFDVNHSGFRKLMRGHRKARVDRGKWILKQLSLEGFELDINEVRAEANGSNIGRPHIAAVMVSKGYVASFKEAFIRYLSNQQLGVIPSDYYTHDEVIDTVKAAGGATIIAHPGQMYSEKELEGLVEAGVDGIEVIHPSHNYELQKKMEGFAEKHDLLSTGGSDFHGQSQDYQKYFGVVTISTEKVNRMKRMINQRKNMLV